MSPELLIQGACASITLRRPEVANKLLPEDLIVLGAPSGADTVFSLVAMLHPETLRHLSSVDAPAWP